ncbi:hypothetical protein OYT88_11345 [Sporolactobacillus sp. CQH2019]|uniref:lysophospholipid acyltransferase family protein n=1 Tax=Sporolactobacillus sp. CQH2019 TaxID=3023512 RepID=UPI00236826F6|nr:hypothetical protein [Sporolactobacillus sp. CQH2019]MDD9149147.1 hypothetical protein [Sporolactobacillus sp. CQH2019]
MSVQKKSSHPLFKSLKRVVRLFFRRRTLIGAENVRRDLPAVFVCNHLGSYAPIMMELFFPYPFRPWVTYHIVTKGKCADYLEAHFAQTELKLRRPFSRWAAAIIAPLCIHIVRATGAIPVYGGSLRITRTLEESLDAIKKGENLVIFPENEEKPFSPVIDDFDVGFIHLGKLSYQKTGNRLPFYPVFINKQKRSISIGCPIIYSPARSFHVERQRIKAYLQESISKMASGR